MAERFHRRSIRLKGYDYAQAGAYYLTVCTHERAHLFGDVVNAEMVPSPMGAMVQRCWDAIPTHMPMVALDEFIVMPNHVHGIIVITDIAVVGRGMVGAADKGGKFPALTPPLRDPGPADDHVTPSEPNDTVVPRRPPIAIMPKNSLGHIMQTFKSAVTRQAVRDGLIERGRPVWQRGYYEHIIRDGADHERIADYIRDNPANWPTDRFHRGR